MSENTNNIKACAFDLGNTLINDTELRETALKRTAKYIVRKNAAFDSDKFIEIYQNINRSDTTPFVSHTFSTERYFEETLRRFGAENAIKPRDALDIYRRHVLDATEVDHDVIEGLKYLRRRDKVVVLLSNESTERVDAYLKKTAIRPLFDHVFVSETVGYEKPDRRIFQFALNMLGICADELVMLGDNDIADGACKELGIIYVGVECYRSPDAAIWESGKAYTPNASIAKVSKENLRVLFQKLESDQVMGAHIDF